MKVNITELSYEPTWHKFGDCELLIRPYPSSQADIQIRGGNMVISGHHSCEAFKYCLVDWKNVVGADGKSLPCTDEVKQKIYDFRIAGIAAFVLIKSREFEEQKASAEGNS